MYHHLPACQLLLIVQFYLKLLVDFFAFSTSFQELKHLEQLEQ